MISKQFTMGMDGLWSRPAELLVRTAEKYACKITVEHMDKCMDAKSMMGVFSLAVVAGDKVTISADGADESEAMKDISALIEAGLMEGNKER